MTEAKHVWPLLRDNLPQVHWMRMENLVGTGMSDVNGCYKGTETWVENKIVKGNRIKLERSQPPWIIKRTMAGGRVFILARQVDALLLWYGMPQGFRTTAKLLADGDLSVDIREANPLLVLERPYNWDLLLEVLFTRKITL